MWVTLDSTATSGRSQMQNRLNSQKKKPKSYKNPGEVKIMKMHSRLAVL